MSKNSLADLAVTGTTIAVRVTPKARANKVVVESGVIKIGVTVPPAQGQALSLIHI